MVRNYLFNCQGVDLFTIPNFLSDVECEYFCNLILSKHVRSEVTGTGSDFNVINESRTSSSSFFDDQNSQVKGLDQKISEELGLPADRGETVQGHLYQVGEQFNDHRDFFEGDGFINNCLASGQRTWTVMIYLNEVEEGGNTDFPEIGKSIAPKRGTAVCWRNSDGAGTENPASIHAGRPVLKGQKMILTKWFRESAFQPEEDRRLALEYHRNKSNGVPPTQLNKQDQRQVIEGTEIKIEYVDGIPHARYGSKENIPKITAEGFKKMSIPFDLYNEIMVYYYQNRRQTNPEFDPLVSTHLSDVIQSKEVQFPTSMIGLNEPIIQKIFDGLQGILTEWSRKKIERTFCYGIRVYHRGAVLKKHTDRFETHIVSAILNIDQRVDQPWALQIDDHQGQEHELFLRPGEMVLYESAILNHGRVKPLIGDYFANLFVHFVNLS